VFVDSLAIDPGDNYVIRLSDALERSRYLVLVLSDHTAGRPWVMQEWTSWMAGHGPLGRLLPVRLDAVELPFVLKATQAIDATDRDAVRTADILFKVVGDPATLRGRRPAPAARAGPGLYARTRRRESARRHPGRRGPRGPVALEARRAVRHRPPRLH
jgi:hypothetical protein